jgi:GPH family glycoside/pentoside/hexuronide:cation symporter
MSSEVLEIKHSKVDMAQYQFATLPNELVAAALAAFLFFFYEVEIGLESWLVGLGLVIYAIWDAINDPLIGYITDRPFGFTKKWGRRFPWIILSFFPMLITFLLIFSPPVISVEGNSLLIFAWLVFTTCIFDIFQTIFTLNLYALYPDKYRKESERLTLRAIGAYISITGTFLGIIVPPMLIIFGQIETYVFMAWVVVVISIVFVPLFIPGIRDDKEVVEMYLAKYEEMEREPLFKALKSTLKHKNLIVVMILLLAYHTMMSTVPASMPYYIRFALNEEAGLMSLLMAVLFLGNMLLVPVWYKLSKKLQNYRKVLFMSGMVMVISAVIFTFFVNIVGSFIISFIFGAGVGGFHLMIGMVFADVIDENVVLTQNRREGIISGLRFFVNNISRVIQALIFTVVHILTGFVEGSDTQTPIAIFGIELHTGVIPAIIVLIGLLVFWKFYTITNEKAKQIKEKLAELKI